LWALFANFCEELDARRIEYAERSISEQAKKTRRSMLSLRKEFDDVNILKEGLHGADIID